MSVTSALFRNQAGALLACTNYHDSIVHRLLAFHHNHFLLILFFYVLLLVWHVLHYQVLLCRKTYQSMLWQDLRSFLFRSWVASIVFRDYLFAVFHLIVWHLLNDILVWLPATLTLRSLLKWVYHERRRLCFLLNVSISITWRLWVFFFVLWRLFLDHDLDWWLLM